MGSKPSTRHGSPASFDPFAMEVDNSARMDKDDSLNDASQDSDHRNSSEELHNWLNDGVPGGQG